MGRHRPSLWEGTYRKRGLLDVQLEKAISWETTGGRGANSLREDRDHIRREKVRGGTAVSRRPACISHPAFRGETAEASDARKGSFSCSDHLGLVPAVCGRTMRPPSGRRRGAPRE
mmetsp:Transcript_7811/g.32306  ORF Transcript_7811/g.32306 Transcript_7811/m.32306 type:complete len:116 (+) Transcript_7811:1297-1644(+)